MSTTDRIESLIEFHGPMEVGDPAPYRATQVVPEWLRQMEPVRSGPGQNPIETVKLCAPFIEAMTAGYIIPLRRTVRFTFPENGRLQYESVGDNEVVSDQTPLGYQGSPFEKAIVVKFKNSWIIKTPPGYSSLFLPLLNRVDFPFQVLAGMVETDRYYREVYFPSICLMRPGTQVTLEQGTPLVQMIPCRREAWQSTTANWDHERRLEAEVDFRMEPHKYREDVWVKKEYR